MTVLRDYFAKTTRLVGAIALICLVGLAIGCERSPEDLEDWRTESGMEQIAEWVQDDSEPMDVRKRGLEILVEDGQHHRLDDVFDGIEDDDQRTEIASAALPTAEQMWNEQDFPKVDDELMEDGGQIAPDGMQAISAVDALYHITPHLEGDDKDTAQDILRDWISTDQEVRTQWSTNSVSRIVEVAGQGATEEAASWILDTRDPANVVASLRQYAPEDDHFYIDEALSERAKEEHPDLSNNLIAAIGDSESEGIVPYAKKAIVDPESGPDLFSYSLETLVEVAPDEAKAPAFEVIETIPDTRRWQTVQELVDAHGMAILTDVVERLPADEAGYADEEIETRTDFICNRINTHVERGDLEEDPDTVSELLTSDHWPAQIVGLRCAKRLVNTELMDEVQALRTVTTPVPTWDDTNTVGDLAQRVEQRLDESD